MADWLIPLSPPPSASPPRTDPWSPADPGTPNKSEGVLPGGLIPALAGPHGVVFEIVFGDVLHDFNGSLFPEGIEGAGSVFAIA